MSHHIGIFDGSSVAEIDLDANPVYGISLTFSQDGPALMSFTARGSSQSDVLFAGVSIGTYLAFWTDDAGSSGAPLFLGKVIDLDPGSDSREINFRLIDPSGAADTVLFNAVWTNATTPATRGYPRLVYNSRIDNDDDETWELLADATVGEIIKDFLDLNLKPLEAAFASPGSSAACYEQADLDLLTIKPQEKVVIMNMTARAAIDMILKQYYPTWRVFFNPATRKWRIRNLKTLAGLTLTLNDPDQDNPVLGLDLNRTYEGKYSAVKIYGPESMEMLDLTMSNGDLTDISDGPLIETFGAGVQVFGKNKWQITDSTKRRMLRYLPESFYAPHTGQTYGSPLTGYTVISNVHTRTRSPTFMVRFPNDNMGNSDWVTVEGWIPWPRAGIVDFGDNYVHRYNPNPPIVGGIQQPRWTNPSDVRLVYSTPAVQLSVRYPETGFSGEVYTLGGVASELTLYDEMLAVEYENNVAVTTVERLDQFKEIAKQLWEGRSKIGYAGVAVLQGLAWDWVRMDKVVNVAAVDENGVAKTTGWESINAFVTDVTYDLSEDTTSITINNDQLEVLGIDPEQMKRALGVRQLERYLIVESASNEFLPYTKKDAFGRHHKLFQYQERIRFQGGFVDPLTGQRQGVNTQDVTVR